LHPDIGRIFFAEKIPFDKTMPSPGEKIIPVIILRKERPEENFKIAIVTLIGAVIKLAIDVSPDAYRVLRGNIVCSAAGVLPSFSIEAVPETAAKRERIRNRIEIELSAEKGPFHPVEPKVCE